VLSWFTDSGKKLAVSVESYNSASAYKRRPLAKPNKPIASFVRKWKMDVGFVADLAPGIVVSARSKRHIASRSRG
jgi:hypothetical protein